MVPPPPFNRAMSIKAPAKPENVVAPPMHQADAKIISVVPQAPVFKPKRPVTKEEIMAKLTGHIKAKMTAPPPPFLKSMTIKAPTNVPSAPALPVIP